MLHDTALSPSQTGFTEIWHAQVLAMADELKNAGWFSAQNWAQSLGAELEAANARGAADTEDTYFLCALVALESLCRDKGGVSSNVLSERKSAWETAYHATPHGQPVTLSEG